MIKLIAIDLDGTLYNSQHQLTERGREAVHQAKDSGIQPVIVTGRGRRGAENALESLGLELPYICAAGALVRPGSQGESWHIWPFYAPAEISPVIEFCRANPSTGLVGEPPEGTPLWFGPDSMNEVMDPLTLKEAFRSRRTCQPERDFDRPLLKVTIIAEPELLSRAESIVRAYCPSLHSTYAGPQYIDLTAEGVNKGTALQALAEQLGLYPDQIAAIGDQCIDLKMLQYAGLPVAMQNAVPELKDVAEWIAPSNDEDGVAWAIDEILKRNPA
ncbi:MAG: Cof-type HAD-IIB family hydrolase [Anaerolineales bacterium]